MSALTVSIISLVAILALIALRIPIGVALGGVSFFGFWYLVNLHVAISVIRDTPFTFAASWDLTAIPMFLLMGAIATNSGVSSALFRAARLWFGNLPGGLAVATNMACAGFAAACGSSVAAAAAMARLAIPEMLEQGYDKSLAAGVVASAGTLAALIPPSILFVLYGIFAQVSIAQLLIAGILPGLLTAAVYATMLVGALSDQPLDRSQARRRRPHPAVARALAGAGRGVAAAGADPRHHRRAVWRRRDADRGRCGRRVPRDGHRVCARLARHPGLHLGARGRDGHHRADLLRRDGRGDVH